MNLVVDIGNTRTKIAIISDSNVIHVSTSEENNKIELLDDIVTKYSSFEKGILSSVKETNSELLKYLKNKISHFHILDEKTSLPFNNQYKTKNTLGKDRIAAIAGAHNIFSGQNVLVIDLGTAITFDFIDKKENYLGGNISPGLKMRFKALNQFTDKLPLLSPNDKMSFLGTSTEDAIITGVQRGIISEIEGFINQTKEKYDDLKIILTGGDAYFFDKKIKNPIFVNLNLNLIGLNRILEYNVR